MAENKEPLAVRLRGLTVATRRIGPHPELGAVVAAPLEALKVWPVVADLVDVQAGREAEAALARLARSVRVGDFFARDGRVAVRDELARRRALGAENPWATSLATALLRALRLQAAHSLDLGAVFRATRRGLREDFLDSVTRPQGLEQLAAIPPSPEEALLLQEARDEAEALLARVLAMCTPGEARLLQAWRDDPDLPLAEVARRLGVAPGTARALLWRVRQKAGHL